MHLRVYTPGMFGNLKGRADNIEESIQSAVAAVKAMATVVILAMVAAILAIGVLSANS